MRGDRATRPAQAAVVEQTLDFAGKGSAERRRYLIIDLNNFARFPTLAIGLLVATLRDRGHQVEVLCPLAHDVPATERERQENLLDHVKRRIHLSDWQPFVRVRDRLRKLETYRVERTHPIVLREVQRALATPPDVILVSAYLQHFESVAAIGALAKRQDVPLVVGGPMFNLPDVADVWRQIAGITAVVGAEVDRNIASLLESVCAGGAVDSFAGVTLPDGQRSHPAAPLRDLDRTPIPDFTDFPWDRYPGRIIPVMTGRGCQWDKCLFCSDVISVSGRTFRTRSITNVLLEIQEQARRHETGNFLFLDLKLNSWPEMLRGLGRGIRRYVQGAEWIGTVHVDQRADNGLSRADLEAAVEGGMRRVSFGLESGSQRLLDEMRKGSSTERNSSFISDAHAAGLSIRCTMFKGFPGETAEDMEQTLRFLEKHARLLDRVRFNAFTVHVGTPIWQAMNDKAQAQLVLNPTDEDHRRGRVNFRTNIAQSAAYRKAKARALDVVYEINRRPLRDTARQFDGLM